jgi:hypothetical protein
MVKLRLDELAVRKTVSSSSTKGMRYRYSSRWTMKIRWQAVTVGVRVLRDVEQVAACASPHPPREVLGE